MGAGLSDLVVMDSDEEGGLGDAKVEKEVASRTLFDVRTGWTLD